MTAEIQFNAASVLKHKVNTTAIRFKTKKQKTLL